MYGIAGILLTVPGSLPATHHVAAMLTAQGHCASDAFVLAESDACILGHTKPSSMHLPGADAQAREHEAIHLAYDGNICNAQEKRRMLETRGVRFVGNSDTEVLVQLYLHYGKDFLAHLRGAYAFALWDARVRLLLCARDPLGIKPFLYALPPEGFLFSSTIKGILASGLVSRRINPRALYALLLRGSVPQQIHILEEAQWLAPGHVMTVRAGEMPHIAPFRRVAPPQMPLRIPWPDLFAEGETRIRAALRRQTTADVPMGALLSGGIDSSLLAALLCEERRQVRSFSVGFESGFVCSPPDETSDAERTARHLGLEHTSIVVTQQDVLASLPSIARALDHPTVDGINTYFAARTVRRDLAIAISGTGGDELFAGYPWFSAMRRWSRASLWERIRRRYGWGRTREDFCSVFDAQYAMFTPGCAAALMKKLWRAEALVAPLREDPFPRAALLNRVTGLVLAGYTRDQLLADIATASSWHGIETRMPLLDEDLLQFALALPEESKIGVKDAAAPEGSYAHTGIKRLLVEMGRPLLPEGFAHRAKRGFTLPFDGWLRDALAPMMHDLLSAESVRKRGFFAPDAVDRIVEEYDAGRIAWPYPWLLMMTELWGREVLDT